MLYWNTKRLIDLLRNIVVNFYVYIFVVPIVVAINKIDKQDADVVSMLFILIG